jgi:hypothetical protein
MIQTLPAASCENVSSDMMSVTSALGEASPFRMAPFFFKSIVHTASFLSSFVIRSSKMPLVYKDDHVTRMIRLEIRGTHFLYLCFSLCIGKTAECSVKVGEDV